MYRAAKAKGIALGDNLVQVPLTTPSPGVEVNLQIKNAALYQKTDGTLWLKGTVNL